MVGVEVGARREVEPFYPLRPLRRSPSPCRRRYRRSAGSSAWGGVDRAVVGRWASDVDRPSTRIRSSRLGPSSACRAAYAWATRPRAWLHPLARLPSPSGEKAHRSLDGSASVAVTWWAVRAALSSSSEVIEAAAGEGLRDGLSSMAAGRVRHPDGVEVRAGVRTWSSRLVVTGVGQMSAAPGHFEVCRVADPVRAGRRRARVNRRTARGARVLGDRQQGQLQRETRSITLGSTVRTSTPPSALRPDRGAGAPAGSWTPRRHWLRHGAGLLDLRRGGAAGPEPGGNIASAPRDVATRAPGMPLPSLARDAARALVCGPSTTPAITALSVTPTVNNVEVVCHWKSGVTRSGDTGVGEHPV